MQKLRRSRFLKFISAMLIVLMTGAIIVNITGTFFLLDENLYYANRSQIQQKVYSYLYEYTSKDIIRYLNTAENMHTNNDSYKNYHQSELELYKSKYSSENSNIFFRIYDEQGHVLLTNNNIHSDNYITFTSGFITDISSDSEWYYLNSQDDTVTVNDSYENEDIVSGPTNFEEIVTYTEITTSYPEENTDYDNEEAFSEEVTEEPEPTMLRDSESYSNYISPAVLNEEENNVEEITVSNLNSGNKTKILYYYSEQIDDNILRYCKDKVRNLNYDITEISFYQNDYNVNIENDYFEIRHRYEITDERVPSKSFSTSLLSEGKTANIVYSYNGSFFMEEFLNRLSLTTLILENSEDEVSYFEYYQKSRIHLTAEIQVPYSSYADDLYKYAEDIVDLAIFYRDNIIIISVFEALVLLLSFAFLFWSAGYIPEKEKPVARYLHRIPFDILIILSAVTAIICLELINYHDDIFVLTGLTGWTLLFVGLSYSLTVKLRTHTVINSCLSYLVFRFIKNSASVLNKNTAAVIKILLTFAAFVIGTSVECLIFLIIGNETSDGGIVTALILLIIRTLEVPVITFILISLTALHNGARRISSGDIDYRINKTFLLGSLRKHASYLNSINDTVNSAVEERVKSESLKTELITNVSHDLKTPLTSIVNYVDLLKKEEITNEKALRYIEVIDRQSQRLKKLTVDIVEASKAATGNIDVHREELILNVFLLQTNGEYIERLQEKSLTLVQDIPEKQIKIISDGRLLWRVIDNLMNNICKYSMPGTRVYLNLTEENGRAYISFRNISKNALNITPESLTERFVRGDTSRNTEGSGLGLSIAKSLTEIMNGALDITIDGDLFKVTISFPVK